MVPGSTATATAAMASTAAEPEDFKKSRRRTKPVRVSR